MRAILAWLMVCGVSSSALAQEAPVSAAPAIEPLSAGFLPLQPMRITMGLGFGAMFMRDTVARQQSIGSVSPLVDVSLGAQLFDLLAVTGAIGIALPADHDMFTATYTPSDGGDEVTADSSVKLYRFQIDATARTPFYALGGIHAGWIAGALFGGVGYAGTTGKRSVDDCGGCDYDEIAVHGGSYFRAGLDVAFPTGSPGGRVGFEVSYEQYFTGSSLNNELLVRGTAWLF